MTALRLLAVCVLPLLASQAGAQAQGGQPDATPLLGLGPPAAPAREVNELPPPGYLGWTECRAGVPVTKIDPTLDSITRMEVRLHEAQHRAQLAVGCDSIAASWDADPRAYVAAEAEAQCVAWHGMQYSPGTMARSAEREALLLASSTRVPTVTRDTIVAAFRLACGIAP